jgi:hypothetical protein
MRGGVGDIITACGATLLLVFALPVTSAWRWRALIFWNVFGLAGILGVVVSALREGLRDPRSMLPLREFPLSMLRLCCATSDLLAHPHAVSAAQSQIDHAHAHALRHSFRPRARIELRKDGRHVEFHRVIRYPELVSDDFIAGANGKKPQNINLTRR